MFAVLIQKMLRVSCLQQTGGHGNGGMEQPIMGHLSWRFPTSSIDSATPWCSAITSTVSQSGFILSYKWNKVWRFIHIRDEILETCIRKPITNIFVQNPHGRGHHCDYKNRYYLITKILPIPMIRNWLYSCIKRGNNLNHSKQSSTKTSKTSWGWALTSSAQS